MRRKSRVSIYSASHVLLELYNNYKNNDIDITYLDTILTVDNLYTDTDIFQSIMEDIKKGNLKYSYAEVREYTKKEMNNAIFFHVDIPYPWEHIPEKDAKYYGTQYEYPNGVNCECQRKQISELIIDVKKIGKKHFVEIIPVYIVSEFAMKTIQAAGLKGCIFKPVTDYKNRDTQKYYQLIVTNVLPPISAKVRIESYPKSIGGCEQCLEKGYLRSEMIYLSEDMREALDFNVTFEHFDAYKQRYLVVSEKVREVLNKNKIRVYGYEPISLI